MGRVLPLLLAVLTLFFLEVSAEIHAPVARPMPDPPPKSRLVIFWIDSLAVQDLALPGRLSRLKARLPAGLHGPVRECMDGVSVPCFTAASTGIDRFSLFAIARNFGGTSGVPEGSVFHALQKRGVKLGFIGDMQIGQAVAGFDWIEIQHEVDDSFAVRRGLEVLERDALDLVVIHLRLPDELSHQVGPESPAYGESLEVIDRDIEAAMQRLRPTDHVIIFGDHGHTSDGRHFAGLDVPTYMAAFGPMFRRPLERPMAITDHASLWAPLFGLRFGDSAWVDAYFAGEPVPAVEPATQQTHGATIELSGLPSVASGNARLPLWAVLGTVVLAFLVSVPHRIRWLGDPQWRALLWVLVGLAVVAFTLGATYTSFRPFIHYGGRTFNTSIGIACGLAGIALAWPARGLVHFEGNAPPATGLAALFMGGAVALALPTVYKFGGLYTGLTGLVVVACVGGVLAVNARRNVEAAFSAALVFVLFLVWNPAVRNFAVRWFSTFSETLVDLAWPTTAILGVAALGLAAGRQWRLWGLAAAAGLALAACGPLLPPRAFIAPCVLLFPAVMLAHRVPRTQPLLALVAPPALAFFFGYDPLRLSPVLCGLAAFPLWARARGRAPLLERAIGLVLLLWLMLWTMLGCRLPGLDFNYFFRWLPPGQNVEDSWAWNTLLTAALYLGTALTGLLFARRAAPGTVEPAIAVAWHFARLKLGLVLLFVVGFSMSASNVGAFIIGDILMEAGCWVMILLLLLPVPHQAVSRRAPSA